MCIFARALVVLMLLLANYAFTASLKESELPDADAEIDMITQEFRKLAGEDLESQLVSSTSSIRPRGGHDGMNTRETEEGIEVSSEIRTACTQTLTEYDYNVNKLHPVFNSIFLILEDLPSEQGWSELAAKLSVLQDKLKAKIESSESETRRRRGSLHNIEKYDMGKIAHTLMRLLNLEIFKKFDAEQGFEYTEILNSCVENILSSPSASASAGIVPEESYF